MMMGNYFVDFFIDLKYGIEGVTLNYIVAALIPVLLGKFNFRSIKSVGIMLLHMLACCVFMMGVCALYYLFWSIAMPQVSGCIVAAAYAILICRFSLKARIMLVMSFASVNANVFVACFSIGDLLATANIDEHHIIVLLLSATLLIACVLFFRAFSVARFDDIPNISLGLVGAVGLTNIIFWILTNTMTIGSATKIIIATVLIILLLFAYYGAFAISSNLSATHKRRAEQLMRETDEHMLRMSESNLEAMRKWRHELKNQYAYMQLLLEKSDFDKLSKYFAEYSGRLNETLSFVDCGNEVVSAVLNIGLNRAEQANARIEYTVGVPAVMKLADTDLCSLLLNLINNAVEYLQRRPSITNRTIYMRLEMINRTLLVSVSNALDDDDRDQALTLSTSKRDRTLHGYGSKVVQTIVERYHGKVSYEAADGQFIVTAMLAEND